MLAWRRFLADMPNDRKVAFKCNSLENRNYTLRSNSFHLITAAIVNRVLHFRFNSLWRDGNDFNDNLLLRSALEVQRYIVRKETSTSENEIEVV